MATWTDVSSTVLEPGDPIRSVDIIAIKENVIALSEGASGAPKILTDAINDAAVTSAKLATGTNERDWVLARTAGASAGAVGTYAFLRSLENADYNFGATLAGSQLEAAGIGTNTTGWQTYTNLTGDSTSSYFFDQNEQRAGTWRCMGVSARSKIELGSTSTATLWLRIS